MALFYDNAMVMKLLLLLTFFCNLTFAMEVTGHRGASLVAPENSLSAIQQALDYDVDGTEFDVYLTRDNQIVISHDATLQRLARFNTQNSKMSRLQFNQLVATNITKLNYDQFKHIDIGSYLSPKFKNERVPLLSEALKILPTDKKYLIEIKDSNPAITVELKKLILAMKLDERQIEFISFDKNQVLRMKKELPTYRALLLLGCGSLSKLPNLNENTFDGYDVELCPLVTKRLVQTVSAADKLLYVWNNRGRSTDNEVNAFRMSEIGVKLFTSDLPLDVVNWHQLNMP